MAVCSGDEYVRSRNAGSLLRHRLGAVEHVPRQDTVVDYNDGNLPLTVIQHKAARIQLIMNLCRPAIRKPPWHGDAEPRSDVAGRCAGTEDYICCEAMQAGHKYKYQGKKAHKVNYKAKDESQSLSHCSLD